MSRRILAAVDESFNVQAVALRHGLGAGLWGDPRVTGALTPVMTGTEEGARAQSAGARVNASEGGGMPAHLLMERGDVVQTLAGFTRAHHTDVVLPAWRCHNAEPRYFLRAIPQRLMGVLECVLIIVLEAHPSTLSSWEPASGADSPKRHCAGSSPIG